MMLRYIKDMVMSSIYQGHGDILGTIQGVSKKSEQP